MRESELVVEWQIGARDCRAIPDTGHVVRRERGLRRIRLWPLWPVLFMMASCAAWGQVVVPFGYVIEPAVTTGLTQPTAMARDGAGRLYVTQYGPGGVNGAVKVVFPGPPVLVRDYATVPQLVDPAGIVVDGTRVVVSNRSDDGQIIEYVDRNGNFFIDDPSEFQILIDNLPGGVNGTRALVKGPDGRFYVGQGSILSSSASEPAGINTRVFSFELSSPSMRTTFASGFFNPLGIAFDPGGRAFVSDRSPAGDLTAPDELNYAEEGDFFGFGVGIDPKPPLVAFPHFSSPAGVAYFPPSEFTGGEEVVYVALEGDPIVGPGELPDPPPRVVQVILHRQGEEVAAEVSDFVIHLEHPFGLLREVSGGERLLISDFEANVIYRVRRRTESDPPDLDVDRSGSVDSGDIYTLMQERIRLLQEGLPEPPDFLKTDFNTDDRIDALDLFILSAGWEGDAGE